MLAHLMVWRSSDGRPLACCTESPGSIPILGPIYETAGMKLKTAIIAIYAPMIYTAPGIMFWMGAYSLRGQVGGVCALESRVFGPCEMPSSR